MQIEIHRGKTRVVADRRTVEMIGEMRGEESKETSVQHWLLTFAIFRISISLLPRVSGEEMFINGGIDDATDAGRRDDR